MICTHHLYYITAGLSARHSMALEEMITVAFEPLYPHRIHSKYKARARLFCP